MTMGQKIYMLRRDNNMTQAQLAAKIGVTYQAVNKYEHDVVTNIPIKRLEKIAEALGTTTSYLRSSSSIVAHNRNAYNVYTDDVDREQLTPAESRRFRLHAIIEEVPDSKLSVYESLLSLSCDRLEALARLLNVQGGDRA